MPLNGQAIPLVNLSAACIGKDRLLDAVNYAEQAISCNKSCKEAWQNLAAALARLSKKSSKYLDKFNQVKEAIKGDSALFGSLSSTIVSMEQNFESVQTGTSEMLDFFSNLF